MGKPAVCAAKTQNMVICGSAGPGGHFCSIKIGHLGDCAFGPGGEQATQKRQRVSLGTAPQVELVYDSPQHSKAAEPRLSLLNDPRPHPQPQPPVPTVVKAPKPVLTAAKEELRPKPAAKPAAKPRARVHVICGSSGPVGSFCSMKIGHLGNCFE